MVLMATLTQRSTECLGGRLHRGAIRRCPSRGIGAAHAAATSDNRQSRPTQGRPRGRKPRHAAATAQPPQKPAMEGVVILKRGEQAVETPVAQIENVESVAATCQLGAQALSETASAADQCEEPSEKADTAIADGRSHAPATNIEAETVKAEKASQTKTETETARKTQVKKAEVVATAKRISPKAWHAEAAPTVYAGASHVVSPDPGELPIPLAFLKPRAGHTAACA